MFQHINLRLQHVTTSSCTLCPPAHFGCWNCCHKMAAKALRHYVSCSWPAACWISPGNNRSICQNCSKCITCSVAAIQFMAPCDNGAICEDRSKCPICSMNLLRMPQLNCRAVTTRIWFAPSNHWSVSKDGSESTMFRTLDLFHSSQLVLDLRTVTSIAIAPSHNWSICQGSKCTTCLKLLHISKLLLDFGDVPKMWNAPSYDRSILQDSSKQIHQIHRLSESCQLQQPWVACFVTIDRHLHSTSKSFPGWWYTYPSEKYESQWEGWQPIYYGKFIKKIMFETTSSSVVASLAVQLSWSPSWMPRPKILYDQPEPGLRQVQVSGKLVQRDFWARILKSCTLEACKIHKISLRPLAKVMLEALKEDWSVYTLYKPLCQGKKGDPNILSQIVVAPLYWVCNFRSKSGVTVSTKCWCCLSATSPILTHRE